MDPARSTPARSPVGISLLVVAAGHLALGVRQHREALGGLLRDGWVGASRRADLAPGEAQRRQTAFWSQTTGVALLLLGVQTAALERRGVPAPRSTGWSLAAVALAGGTALPVSGFWALLVPAALALRGNQAAG